MEAGYNPAVVMTEKESTSANSFAVRCKKAKHGTARHSASNRSGPAVNADAAMTEPIRSAQAKPRKGFYATTL